MSIDVLDSRGPSTGNGVGELTPLNAVDVLVEAATPDFLQADQTSIQVVKSLIETVTPGYRRTDSRHIELEGGETIVNRYEVRRTSGSTAAIAVDIGLEEFGEGLDVIPGQGFRGLFMLFGDKLVKIDANTYDDAIEWGPSKQAVSFIKTPEGEFTEADIAALDIMRNDLASIQTDTQEPLRITTTGAFGTGRSLVGTTEWSTYNSVSGSVFS